MFASAVNDKFDIRVGIANVKLSAGVTHSRNEAWSARTLENPERFATCLTVQRLQLIGDLAIFVILNQA